MSDDGRHPPAALVDTAITVAVVIATVAPNLVPQPKAWPVLVASVLASLPVAVRRRWPILGGSVVAAATTALVVYTALPSLPFGALVFTYTIATLEEPLKRRAATALGCAVLVISLVVPGERLPYYGYVGMLFVTAYALGTGTRARRSQIDALQERTARLEEERRAAASQERTRIARDMHDILTHSVGLMVVQAEAGAQVVRTDPARGEQALETVADQGRDAIAQLRVILDSLRTSAEPRGAPPGVGAIGELVEQVARIGPRITLLVHGEARPLPPDIDVAAYRIVQESLTNVIRHAQASRADVAVEWTRTGLLLSVVDDGVGPRPSRRASGHGVLGMTERATACGGTLQTGLAGSAGGFAVRATFPRAPTG